MIAEGAERNLAEPGEYAHFYARDGQGHIYFNDVANWRRIPAFERYVLHSAAAEIAARLMGSRKVNIFYDSLFYRTAGTSAPTPWHQDVPYWCIEGQDVCSIWTPIDPVPRESALEFVRGSHRSTAVYYRESFFEYGNGHSFDGDSGRPNAEAGRTPTPDVDADRSEYDIVAWDMEPGDCLAFCGMVLHGAPGNRSEARPLRALARRWPGDDARYALKPEGADPDLKGHGLESGEPFGGPMFPVVWRAGRD